MDDMKQYTRLLIVIAVVGIFCVLLPGCGKNKQATSDPFFEKWRTQAENTKGYSPTARPPEREAHQEAPKAVPTPETEPATSPLPTVEVTLSMHDAPVAAVLRALAKAAGQSIMISNTVEGTANISAVGIPWDTVFLGVLNTYGLSYEQTGSILKIKTAADLDKEWEKEKAELRQKQLRWQLQHTEAFETQIFFIRYADAVALGKILSELIEGSPQAVVGAQPETDTVASSGNLQQASVTVDEATNAILAHAAKEKIQQLSRVVQELDRPTLQVLIEAQIVETNRDTARALGIQWGGLNYEENGNKLNWIGGSMADSGPLFTDAGEVIIHQPSSGNIVNFPADLADSIGATLGYRLQDLSANYILTMQLSALQKEGKLNILSSPSITTLDNQPASIESGREVPFQTVVGAGSSSSVSIEYKKAVLSLKVTPHTIDRSMLRLNVVTHKDELDFTNVVQGNPTIITKNAETNVILYDGQTMVIGGLSKETASDSESGVPVLKDIPLLGRLFKSTGKSGNMEEVLIFITPHILKEKPKETAAAQLSGETREQLEQDSAK